MRRALALLERLASRPLGRSCCSSSALRAYAVRAVAWPLKPGRDLDEYLLAYVQLFDHDVLLPWSMLFRTPVTPLFAGALARRLGRRLAEPLDGGPLRRLDRLLGGAARYFGPRVAIAVAPPCSLYPGYALMFHELSSEPVFAAAFAAVGAARRRGRPFAAVGRTLRARRASASRVLALVRPGKRRAARFRLRSRCCSREHGASALRAGRRVRRSPRSLPLAGVVRAQRRALRLLGARARRQRDRPVLPRVHHRPHRLARERRALAPARRGDAAPPPDARAVPLVRRHARRAVPSRGASACTRTCTSSPTRSSAGTPTTACSAERASRACGRIPGRTPAASRGRSGTSSRRRSSASSRPGERRRADVVGAGDRRDRRQEASRADRGRADPGGSGRLDLAARPEHPAGLDVADRVALRVRRTRGPPRVSSGSGASRATSSTRCRTARATRSSHSASTSSRAGTRGRGCGSCSAWSRSPCGDRAAGRSLVALSLAALAVVLLNALGLFADLHFVLPVAPAFVLLGARRAPRRARPRRLRSASDRRAIASTTRSPARPSTSPTTWRATRRRSSASSAGCASARSTPRTTSSKDSAR